MSRYKRCLGGFGQHLRLPIGFILLVWAFSLLSPPRALATYWSSAGSLPGLGRYGRSTTLLPDGKVLVAGGGIFGGDLADAYRYDPGTGQWSYTDDMDYGRSGHTATLLPNGNVLIAGGYQWLYSKGFYLNTTELYNPAQARFSPAIFKLLLLQ